MHSHLEREKLTGLEIEQGDKFNNENYGWINLHLIELLIKRSNRMLIHTNWHKSNSSEFFFHAISQNRQSLNI